MPINEKYLAQFEPDFYYHVYNRCHPHKKLFTEEKNYYFFLSLLKRFTSEILDIYAYALIPNHFHLLVKVKPIPAGEKSDTHKVISAQFRRLFVAYTNSLNKMQDDSGSLFQTPYRRIKIGTDAYFTQVIYYLHYNPVHHNICHHPSQYKFSSYNSFLSNAQSDLKRKEVIEWFGGIDLFKKYHELQSDQFTQLPFYIEH
ncbi:MAG: transposase [Chitinophagaceae bacterium]